MPYLVTTMYGEPRSDRPGHVGGVAWERVSRLAVATLGKARSAVKRAIMDLAPESGSLKPYLAAQQQADALPESGGTVGPLPDGTTIRVELAATGDLAAAALVANDYHFGELTEAEVIAAFNAKQA